MVALHQEFCIKCKAVNNFHEEAKALIPEDYFLSKLELIHSYQNAAEISRQPKKPEKSVKVLDEEMKSPAKKEDNTDNNSLSK